MMTLVCIKQSLSNIWSTTHEKVKQHWGWVEKSVAYKELLITYKGKIPDLLNRWFEKPKCFFGKNICSPKCRDKQVKAIITG